MRKIAIIILSIIIILPIIAFGIYAAINPRNATDLFIAIGPGVIIIIITFIAIFIMALLARLLKKQIT
jgi:hypothetical protein